MNKTNNIQSRIIPCDFSEMHERLRAEKQGRSASDLFVRTAPSVFQKIHDFFANLPLIHRIANAVKELFSRSECIKNDRLVKKLVRKIGMVPPTERKALFNRLMDITTTYRPEKEIAEHRTQFLADLQLVFKGEIKNRPARVFKDFLNAMLKKSIRTMIDSNDKQQIDKAIRMLKSDPVKKTLGVSIINVLLERAERAVQIKKEKPSVVNHLDLRIAVRTQIAKEYGLRSFVKKMKTDDEYDSIMFPIIKQEAEAQFATHIKQLSATLRGLDSLNNVDEAFDFAVAQIEVIAEARERLIAKIELFSQ